MGFHFGLIVAADSLALSLFFFFLWGGYYPCGRCLSAGFNGDGMAWEMRAIKVI